MYLRRAVNLFPLCLSLLVANSGARRFSWAGRKESIHGRKISEILVSQLSQLITEAGARQICLRNMPPRLAGTVDLGPNGINLVPCWVRGLYYYRSRIFAARGDSDVGQVCNLRPICNRPRAVNRDPIWLRLRCSVGQTPSSARDPLVALLRPTGRLRQAHHGGWPTHSRLETPTRIAAPESDPRATPAARAHNSPQTPRRSALEPSPQMSADRKR